ncbi:MAG: hypothetical protein ACK4IY_07155 [Chitinophagales bacterium]
MLINLLSGPRNISTAMMYSFAQRKDTYVVDEPLYAHFLKLSHAAHPGRDAILAAQENSGDKVIENLMLLSTLHPFVFVKHMTHHLVHVDWHFMLRSKNILLLRAPEKVLLSYSKIIAEPAIEDIGIKQSFDLYNYLQGNNAHFIILDSDDILKAPETMLQKICASCAMPFDKNMLQWEAGAIAEDGVWAKYWYKNVHSSTGFGAYTETDIHLPEKLQPINNEANYYYKILLQHALK